MASSDRLRQRAERLFALALQARERGDISFADQLTLRAMECLDEANGTEDIQEPPPTTESSRAAVPQQRQQQNQKIGNPDEQE